MTSYFIACDVTVAISNRKNFVQLCWRAFVPPPFWKSFRHLWCRHVKICRLIRLRHFCRDLSLERLLSNSNTATVPIKIIFIKCAEDMEIIIWTKYTGIPIWNTKTASNFFKVHSFLLMLLPSCITHSLRLGSMCCLLIMLS